MNNDVKRLSDCTAGTHAVIVDVDEGPDAKRIKALGLCSGHAVRIARAGKPFIVDIFNTRVALDPDLARLITVTSCPERCHAS